MSKEKKETQKVIKKIAKKDFVICHNDYYCRINKGDDLNSLNIPEIYNNNLKKEEVL